MHAKLSAKGNALMGHGTGSLADQLAASIRETVLKSKAQMREELNADKELEKRLLLDERKRAQEELIK